MKTKSLAILLAATAIGFASCNNDENPESQVNENAIPFSTTGLEKFSTRLSSTGNAWLESDRIGIYMFSAGELEAGTFIADNVEYKTATSGASSILNAVTETDAIEYPSNSVDFMAYHPYQSGVTEAKYAINLTDQSTGFVDKDLVYAATTTGYTTGEVALAFRHVLSKLILKVTNDGVAVNVSNLSISAPVTADFNLRTATFGEKTTGTITPYTDEQDTDYTRTAIVFPSSALNELTVSFTYDGENYTWPVNENVLSSTTVTEFKAGYAYTFILKLGDGGSVSAEAVAYGTTVGDWQDGTSEGGTGTPTVPAQPMTINNSTVLQALGYGETVAIDYTLANGLSVTGWASSNGEAISVDASGNVTVLTTAAAEATLTATLSDSSTKDISVKVAVGRLAYSFADGLGIWSLYAGASPSYNGEYTTVQMAESSGKYRGDLSLSATSLSSFVVSPSYGVVAMKIAFKDAGNSAVAISDGNIKTHIRSTNSESLVNKQGGKDYSTLTGYDDVIYYEFNTGYTAESYTLNLFEIKIADFTTATAYDIHWIRTFASVEELEAFVNN